MAARRIQLRLPPAIRKKIGNWLADIPIEQMLVNQAKRRIDKGGDSEISYKRLWADTFRARKISERSRITRSGNITSDFLEVQKAEKTIRNATKRLEKLQGIIDAPSKGTVVFDQAPLQAAKAAASLARAQAKLKRLGGSGGRSFRAGGKPLLDTRQHIYNTLHGTRSRTARSVVYHLRGSLIAVYHQNGFSTKGPNYIPLTLRGRREHQKGADPRLEGLVQGVDYIIARRGVTVPPRPLFRLAPEDRREIIATIRTEIRRRTKRRAA